MSCLNLQISDFSPKKIFYNLSYEELYEHEVSKNEGVETSLGALAIDTGKFTGRSPNDKFFVDEATSNENIWWGNVNRKIPGSTFQTLKSKALNHLEKSPLYVVDAFCGANEKSRFKVRVLCEFAWQAHFCKNMFIQPTAEELVDFKPDFTVVNACKVVAENWRELGLNSEVFIVFNLGEKMAIIGGTYYAGEMKKGLFSVMNYYLPLQNILSMHCSANCDKEGNTFLLFGLSGTGKTTLSADEGKYLIGDDEHGWDEDGIFNFEGGCYAKTIRLDPLKEPEIYRAIKRNALLENVVFDAKTKIVNFDDDTKTENTRVSYPLSHIEKIVKSGKGKHPKAIIFLTCDAFGILPPVAKLSNEQALYYFLSGYTAKIAGTERGIKQPQATFSPCFGGPFLTLHPTVYAKILGEKLARHKSKVYLVNTGWTGGAYGVGKRMDLPLTRAIIHSIQDGSIEQSPFVTLPIFNLSIPLQLNGVKESLLNPSTSWQDKMEYEKKAIQLAEMFIRNFKQYEVGEFNLSEFGPKLV